MLCSKHTMVKGTQDAVRAHRVTLTRTEVQRQLPRALEAQGEEIIPMVKGMGEHSSLGKRQV